LRVFFLGYESDCRAGQKQREYAKKDPGKLHRNLHEAQVSAKADFPAVTAVTGFKSGYCHPQPGVYQPPPPPPPPPPPDEPPPPEPEDDPGAVEDDEIALENELLKLEVKSVAENEASAAPVYHEGE